MDDALDFTGQVVLVTGGTRGIGRGIAARFAAAGAQVVTCGRRPPDAASDNPAFVACDVRDPDQVDELVVAITERFGRLDVAVNNAGGGPTADAATASPRFTEAVIRLNLLAPMHVSQAANRVMQGQPEGGSIVNIASLSGVRPSPGTAAYGAAKAGLLSLTQSLAIEWAPRVRVNAVVAGMVLTEEARPHYGDDESIARVAATVPLGRMAGPDDVAAACLFLASPLAAYVSGATLEVHGGGEPPPFLAVVQDAKD
jgi:NAD(P)-dependent dehydrogenase (short-subunit alcohol dehydrogenase family)